MKILIVGLGSIAQKHIKAIKKIDDDYQIFALRSKPNAKKVSDVINIYSFDEIPHNIDFCIISNPTFRHYETIDRLINLKIPLFIEKPSLMNLDGAEKLLGKIKKENILTYVAYNLRFHPLIKFLKDYIKEKRILEANIYCGSYLPDWRPNRDYTKIYSAIAEMGGGVHLDLIHEIDYSIYLFGYPKESFSVRRKISDLEINSTDIAVYHLIYSDKMVNITLNYYRKFPKREIEIIFDDRIIKADLLNNIVTDCNGKIIFSQKIDIMFTYFEQMKYFYKLLSSQENSMSTFEQSLQSLKVSLK